MASPAASLRADLKTTEHFLLAQDGVVDASVWFTEGELMANIIVFDVAQTCAEEIQSACLEHLGAHQTPSSIGVMAARRRCA